MSGPGMQHLDDARLRRFAINRIHDLLALGLPSLNGDERRARLAEAAQWAAVAEALRPDRGGDKEERRAWQAQAQRDMERIAASGEDLSLYPEEGAW
ncbi:hypothetical protein [Streptomyces sp. NPDC055085]